MLASKCFLCKEEEETIDNLLVHCKSARLLWDLFLAIVGSSWVFPLTVGQTLLSWQGAQVGKKHKKIWLADLLCLLWILWRERNRVTFESEVPFAHRMKANFLSILWS